MLLFRRAHPLLATACAAVLAGAAACGGTSTTAGRTGSGSSPEPGKPGSGVPTRIPTRAPGSCHASSLDPATTRPDPKCTPGATNPDVTQANIHTTICVAGYTKKIRPPVAYTNRLKRQQISDYGYKDTDPSRYEEDHFIPLSIGGHPTDPRNLWPEPGGSPNPKDQVEFKLYKAVCAGQVTLAAAQKAMAENWTTAGRLVH
ncbi:hypothetical protein DZF91_34455 [Actinomadura logoneensis]|uniref:HNH endonuclease n=1 Tax=Actinomadura logoneensis TaxID=2293572 RepID=A0A372JAZ7_9ACTN|nr:hypothetical protein [Actinomadura logoneensis]RFU37142.1 hypothetical protein DZF91_34455 [Actinomadura logoneensis]